MGFFRRLLDRIRKTPHDPLDLVEEYWEADFKKKKQRRFTEVNEQFYRAYFEEDRLFLQLLKKSLFAWVEDPLYRYRDLVIDGMLDFDSGNGHSSAGFLFRHTGVDTYYYFLVSNRGYFRFDAVFNGNPIKLIGWTRIEGDFELPCTLRVIANGSFFVFCINEETVAEIADETIDAGGIAFAAQNYEEKETSLVSLRELRVESRPYHVEAQYVRWKELYPIASRQRVAFGESLYNIGHYNAAVIQYKKASRKLELETEDLLLYGESLLRLELYEQVIDVAESVLMKEPNNLEGVILKADALYSLHRLLEAQGFIRGVLDAIPESPVLWNILGNTEYALGGYEPAADCYDKALELNPEAPIFSVNAGKTYQRLGIDDTAVQRYVRAALLLFRQEAFDDLIAVLGDIDKLDPGNPAAEMLRGKMLFQDGEFEKAGEIFSGLIESENADASIYYLAGLLRQQEGKREDALSLFRKAAQLEEDYYLYWFRLAETEYSLGIDPSDSLHRALSCSADDPWVYNFAGLLRMEKGEYREALEYFTQAWTISPAQEDICINYSEALCAAGEAVEALELLRKFPEESPRVTNQLGNILSRIGDFREAAEAYERSLSADPETTAYIENAAAVYVELEQFTRAEELLRKGLEKEPTARQYNLMGTVATMLGEYSRAEKAYDAGLELEPGNQIIRGNLADLLCTLGNFARAKEIVTDDPEFENTQKGNELLRRISDATELRFTCASCGREWVAPKEVPEQGVLRPRGELPDESPAGECPDCGSLFCVECGKEHLEQGRFTCKDCGTRLKLLDDRIKYLVSRYI